MLGVSVAQPLIDRFPQARQAAHTKDNPMTDKTKPAPHPTAANDPVHAKPKATRPAAPKPAPRGPIPSAPVQLQVPFRIAPSKGKIAAAVGVTLAAGALIGRAVFGVAGKMLRRGR